MLWSEWTPDWAATLSASQSCDDTPTKHHKGSVECQQWEERRADSQWGGSRSAAATLKAPEKQYYWSRLSIDPTPTPLLILLPFGWIRPPLCTHAVCQRCAAGSQWVPTGLPPPLHPPLLSGAGTAPWRGHLSWRTWAASGCLCWALRVWTGTDKTVKLLTIWHLKLWLYKDKLKSVAFAIKDGHQTKNSFIDFIFKLHLER